MSDLVCIEEKCVSKNDCPIIKHFYEKGRADAFREIAYSDSVIKEPFETLAYEKGRADAEKEFQGLKDLGKLYSEIMADALEEFRKFSYCKVCEEKGWNIYCDYCRVCQAQEYIAEQLKEQK